MGSVKYVKSTWVVSNMFLVDGDSAVCFRSIESVFEMFLIDGVIFGRRKRCCKYFPSREAVLEMFPVDGGSV